MHIPVTSCVVYCEYCISNCQKETGMTVILFTTSIDVQNSRYMINCDHISYLLCAYLPIHVKPQYRIFIFLELWQKGR